MVHMVQPDAPGEPLQERGQPEMRAAAQRRIDVIPLAMWRPISVLELVLYVEQPHAGHGGEVVRERVREQHRFPPDRDKGERQQCRNGEVSRPHAGDLHGARRTASAAESLAEQQMNRAAEKKREWMPNDAVPEARAGRPRAILAHGERRDVAVATTVEIAR